MQDGPQSTREPAGAPLATEDVDSLLAQWSHEGPLSREILMRLVDANGGTPQGLNLGGGRDLRGASLNRLSLRGARLVMANLGGSNLTRADLTGADLQGADLQGARLVQANCQSVNLRRANLQGADLTRAKLEGTRLVMTKLEDADFSRAELQDANLSRSQLGGAVLWGCDLQRANFSWADLHDANLSRSDLQGADLSQADLRNADLEQARISGDTNLQHVIWDKDYVNGAERKGRYAEMVSTYRAIKSWYEEHGYYDVAGEFHHREWVCRRKSSQQGFFGAFGIARVHGADRSLWSTIGGFFQALRRAPWSALWNLAFLLFYEQLMGYGERPWRVVRSAIAVMIGLGLAYYFLGSFSPSVRLIDAFYFSAVSFSALGYGGWVQEPSGWARYVAAAESFLGVFTFALFLVTFLRKMSR